MIVTTTPGIEGHSVSDYLGVVAAQGVLGVNVFKDVAAGKMFLRPKPPRPYPRAEAHRTVPTSPQDSFLGRSRGLSIAGGAALAWRGPTLARRPAQVLRRAEGHRPDGGSPVLEARGSSMSLPVRCSRSALAGTNPEAQPSVYTRAL